MGGSRARDGKNVLALLTLMALSKGGVCPPKSGIPPTIISANSDKR
jgi:hypothetical protein